MRSSLLLSTCLLTTTIVSAQVASRHETLGPLQDANGAAVALASGSGSVIAGVGLSNANQPSNLSIAIPAGASVNQVFAYWTGESKTTAGLPAQDTILLNGQSVTGIRVGGPDFFFNFEGSNYTGSYRADVTSLALIQAGPNNVAISGVDFDFNLGFGLYAIIQEGTASAVIALRDGNDNAFINFPEPRKSTIAQTYSFAAAGVARTATLNYMAGSVGPDRPNVIEVNVDTVAAPIRIIDPLRSAAGNLFDAYTHTVPVPAGATSITVRVISEDGHSPATGRLPASLNWIVGGLTLPLPAATGNQGCTPGYWKNHTEAWPAPYKPNMTLGAAFGFSGIPAWDTKLANQKMISALQGGGGGKLTGATRILVRAATAALLNAASSKVNYPLTVIEVKTSLLSVLGLPAVKSTRAILLDLAAKMDRINNLGCGK